MKNIICLSLFLLSGLMLFGQVDDAKKIDGINQASNDNEVSDKIVTQRDALDQKIIDMLNLSGGQANFDAAINQMVDLQKAQFESDSESEDFWNKFKAELKGESYDYLYELLIPIYKAHLSEEEIDAAIAYYKTPLGKSLIAKTPLIMKESMQAGAAWGQQVAELIVKKMEDRKE